MRIRAFRFYSNLLEATLTRNIAPTRSSVEYLIVLAEQFGELLYQRENWEVITGPSLAVLNFRDNPISNRPERSSENESQLNNLNQFLSDRIISDGKAMLATTIVRGMAVLRFCLINPRTTMQDLAETITTLECYAEEFNPVQWQA